MTEENTMTEFGTHTGRVNRFFNRKGYGFIHDLNVNTDYFVHNTEIKCSEGVYRKLYPGEYVSYNLVEREGKNVCTDVRGIMGYPLLVENEDHTFRVYPKSDRRMFRKEDESSTESDSDECIDEAIDEVSDLDEDKDHEKIVNEFINKEAPEGIEVAEFEGLNINEEMS
jgi:cold shock CspA family protein